MLTDELRRSQPHEVHPRGTRPAQPPWGEDQDDTAGTRGPARTVHRLRRIRQVSQQAISVIDQALSAS
ncbi:hypothetical protein HII36_26495 [Nonomuraea sp. NN258]|uniref:hypothetical protein n=1 Tax=Nonomuraea antri TaxID=2730852 RepID=UPI001569E9C0|nr:hypothetical protein [Nonomuraea antri]NRQ35350.1 hypothetical protein [Nonomuraea antri]